MATGRETERGRATETGRAAVGRATAEEARGVTVRVLERGKVRG